MSTFYNNYVEMCAKCGKSLSAVAESIGLSRTAPNGWKKGKMPNDTTLAKLSNYFGITVDELKNGIKKEPSAPKSEELDKNDAVSNLRDNVLYHFPDATPQDVSALMNAIEGTDLTVQELIRIAEMFRRMSPADRKFVKGIFEAYAEAK